MSIHGTILAKELKAVGINYSLSVVSDLDTQNLTFLRDFSKDAEKVSSCNSEIMKAFIQADDIIFVKS